MKIKIIKHKSDVLIYYVRRGFFQGKIVFIGTWWCSTTNRLYIQKQEFPEYFPQVRSIGYEIWEDR